MILKSPQQVLLVHLNLLLILCTVNSTQVTLNPGSSFSSLLSTKMTLYLLASTLMATQHFWAASETLSSSQLDISCADCSSSPKDRVTENWWDMWSKLWVQLHRWNCRRVQVSSFPTLTVTSLCVIWDPLFSLLFSVFLWCTDVLQKHNCARTETQNLFFTPQKTEAAFHFVSALCLTTSVQIKSHIKINKLLYTTNTGSLYLVQCDAETYCRELFKGDHAMGLVLYNSLFIIHLIVGLSINVFLFTFRFLINYKTQRYMRHIVNHADYVELLLLQSALSYCDVTTKAPRLATRVYSATVLEVDGRSVIYEILGLACGMQTTNASVTSARFSCEDSRCCCTGRYTDTPCTP